MWVYCAGAVGALPPAGWPGSVWGAGVVCILVTTLMALSCFGSKKVEATLKMTNNAANVHVDFSMKSVVLRTPIIAFEAEKPEAKPPPFDSWIKTTSVNSTPAITAKMIKTVYILLIFMFVIYN